MYKLVPAGEAELARQGAPRELNGKIISERSGTHVLPAAVGFGHHIAVIYYYAGGGDVQARPSDWELVQLVLSDVAVGVLKGG